MVVGVSVVTVWVRVDVITVGVHVVVWVGVRVVVELWFVVLAWAFLIWLL